MMNKQICSKCGMLHAFVLDDTMSFDKKPYLFTQFYCLNEYKGVLFKNSEKVVERYILKNNKWTRISKTSFFRQYSDKNLNDDFIKKMELEKECPYYLEHQLNEWNKNES